MNKRLCSNCTHATYLMSEGFQCKLTGLSGKKTYHDGLCRPEAREFKPIDKCPDCGLPVTFKKKRTRTECLCGVHVSVDGDVGRICERCEKRHWSDKAALNCKQYLLWNKNRDLIPTWQEEGTKDDRPLYMEGIHWSDIRQAILKRDHNRCTECGNDGTYILAVHHIHPRSWGGTEHPRNLRTLCDECHVKAHQKLALWNPRVSGAMKDEAQTRISP